MKIIAPAARSSGPLACLLLGCLWLSGCPGEQAGPDERPAAPKAVLAETPGTSDDARQAKAAVLGTLGRPEKGLRQEFYDVTFADPDHGWIVGYHGAVLHTTDGGKHWVTVDAGTRNSLFSVSCSDANSCYVAGEAGLILKTTDGGKSWKPQKTTTAQPLLAMRVANDQCAGSAGAGGTFVITEDAGQTWVDRSLADDVTLNALLFTDCNHVWVLGEFGMIFHSDDGGRSWALQHTLGTVREIKGLDIRFGGHTIFGGTISERGDLWVVGIEGTMARLRSETGALEEVRLPIHEPLFGVAFGDDLGIAVGGRGTVVLSRDGGETWNSLSRDQLGVETWFRAVAVAGTETVAAVGGRGSVFVSPDGGKSWTSARP